MSKLYIGLNSGTSMDAIDAVLVDLDRNPIRLIATHSEIYPPNLKAELLEICEVGNNEINRLGQLDRRVGEIFAVACQELLLKAGLSATSIHAIGSHGQTVRHQPYLPIPFTLQIGDPNTIADKTGITTIADFRRRDIVQGGQGAPLIPAFHNYLFRKMGTTRIILNIGGIANLTLLPGELDLPILGFDCGPGNTLMDIWIQLHRTEKWDQGGLWASQGTIDEVLLGSLLEDPYFHLDPPKSTGKEYFNLPWLYQHKEVKSSKPVDVQATLSELTSVTIAHATKRFKLPIEEILICGGGVHNQHLISRLRHHCDCAVFSTQELGIDPDWIEAMGFAWLAKQTLSGTPGNIPAVTGANKYTILGGIYPK